MRLVTFETKCEERLGAQVGEVILDLNKAVPGLPPDMLRFLAGGKAAMELARKAIAPADETACLPLADVTLLAPVPRPGKILCIGHNYAGHIGIGRTEQPEYPNMFCKTANTIIGHRQSILIPRVSSQVDYEAELAVIIGKRGFEIPEAQSMAYVAGYSIFNDVSARDYQKRTNQWFLGKSFNTFGPLGPCLVTTDEVPNPHRLELELKVNGITKQHTNTADLIFNIPYLVSYLSQVMTLDPGDIIATGTPAKLPEAADPQRFLAHGDIVEISIENLGTLSNDVRES